MLEKVRRRPANCPVRMRVLADPIPITKKDHAPRRSVRDVRVNMSTSPAPPLPLAPARPLYPPWVAHVEEVEFRVDPSFEATTEEQKVGVNHALFAEFSRSWTLLTDGSVGAASGWGARLVDPMGRCFDDSGPAGDADVCSYSAEARAMLGGLTLLAAHLQETPPTRRILVATDSQSLLRALQRGPVAATETVLHSIWAKLLGIARTRQVVLAFIYAHCEDATSHHGAVDRLAKAAAARRPRAEDLPPLWWKDAVAPGRRWIRAEAARVMAAVESYRKSVVPAMRSKPRLPRTRGRHVRWLMQMRTGACAAIGGWRKPHSLPPRPQNCDPCPLCGRQQNRDSRPHPVSHFLACTGNAQVVHLRQTIGAARKCDLSQPSALWTHGEAMMEFLRAVAPYIANVPAGPGPPLAA